MPMFDAFSLLILCIMIYLCTIYFSFTAHVDGTDSSADPDDGAQQCPDQGSASARTSVDPPLSADGLASPLASRDLGYIADGTIDLEVLSDKQRLAFLKDPFVPPKQVKLLTQTVTKGKCNRQNGSAFKEAGLKSTVG